MVVDNDSMFSICSLIVKWGVGVAFDDAFG